MRNCRSLINLPRPQPPPQSKNQKLQAIERRDAYYKRGASMRTDFLCV